MIRRALLEEIQPYTHFCVGSLPFSNPEAAVSFILEHDKIIPFWPELPAMHKRELIVERSLCARANSWQGYEREEASGFFTLLNAIRNKNCGLIKGQALGPLTYLLALAEEQITSQKLEEATQIVLKQAIWQRNSIQEVSKASFLFVLDEPGLGQWPKFDQSTKDLLLGAYSYLYSHLSEEGMFVGVHSCSAHFSEILCLPFDLYSFDWCLSFEEKRKQLLNEESWEIFLKRGGILAVGAYPAIANENFEETMTESDARFEEFYNSYPQYRGQILKSANCGHARAKQEWLDACYADAISKN